LSSNPPTACSISACASTAGRFLTAFSLRPVAAKDARHLSAAAGANPNSKLECFRGSVLALTVKTIGIGAKLTIKENRWVGPKLVPYEPLSRDRVGRYGRQNDEPAPPPPLADDSLAEGTPGVTKVRAENRRYGKHKCSGVRVNQR
jgi:hypothetical protein